MDAFQDDKANFVVPFIVEEVAKHQRLYASSSSSPPFFVGLNGVQGAGKTVLVSILQEALQNPPHSLPTVVLSIDDFYLTHKQQLELAASHPSNPLLQHRGQPSTHSITLLLETLTSLKENRPTYIPEYDKAAFDGQGDRLPPSQWKLLNKSRATPIKVVILEGWCIGFRSLSPSDLKLKHHAAQKAAEDPKSEYSGRLGHNTLESVATINDALHAYETVNEQFDAFVHIDAADPLCVYHWRLEQEATLRQARGTGMTDEQVRSFVDGYYPAYELYTEALRQGCLTLGDNRPGTMSRRKQLRLVIGRDRLVREVVQL